MSMARRLFASFHKTKGDTTIDAESDKLTQNTEADHVDRLCQNIVNGIKKISQNVSVLEMLVKQIGSPQDTDDLRGQVSQTASFTHQIAKDTNKDIKELLQLPLPTDPNAQQHDKQQREKLTTEFHTALKSFETVERAAAEKERASLSGTIGSSDSEDDWAHLSSEDIPRTQGAKMLPKVTEADLTLLKKRQEDIFKLERGVEQIHAMFTGMATLVQQQGEMIDRIEYNVEQAVDYVEQAKLDTGKSHKYQIKAMRKLCCMIVTFLSIVIIVGIVLTVVVNRLVVILPIASFVGIIITVVCTGRFMIKFKLKSTSDGTDFKLKVKGTQKRVDFEAEIKA